MSTSKALTRPMSRSNSTRSRKHSAPVQIHALLGTTSTDGTSRKHGQGHRRGASLSASATGSPTPVDRPTMSNNGVDNKPTMTPPASGLAVSNETSSNTHSSSHQTRQRSHSYASAPLSTLLTHLDSSPLASFTLADPHPCATNSLKRCQWMMEMNASGNWHTSQNGDPESTDNNHVQHTKVDNKKTRSPTSPTTTTSSPVAPKRKRMLALPLRIWKKQNMSFANHKWDSESDSHADVEDDGTYCEEESDSDGDGADDTPSLTPHSSRRSSRSRSSAGPQSPTSPPSELRFSLPPISRSTSKQASPSPVTGPAKSGAKPAPASVAVRHNGDAKVSPSMTTGSPSVKKVFGQDPGTALQQYKEAPMNSVTMPTKKQPSLTIKTQQQQNMQTELIPARTLRSTKNRRISSSTSSTLNSNNNNNNVRIPFPVNPPPLSPSTPNSKPTVLLTLSDLERTSKLMRSTTTCAVCGRSGSDFPRCPRTGVAWCSRDCRIAAKKSAHIL